MTILKELLVPVFFGVFSVVYYLTTNSFAPQSIVFPYAVMAIMPVLAVLIVFSEYRKSRSSPAPEPTVSLVKPAIIFGLSSAYFVVFIFTHYLVATAIFLATTMISLKVPWRKSVVIAVLFSVFLYVVFGKIFLVPI